MNTFLIDKPLDEQAILKILKRFQSEDLGIFNERYNYYAGKHKILLKRNADTSRDVNNCVTNFVKNIVDTYTGYSVGIPVSYECDDEQIIDCLNYNDVSSKDSEFFKNACIFGRAVEIMYMDKFANVCFMQLDPRECIPVYDNTLESNLVAAIRFWRDSFNGDFLDSQYYVEVYYADRKVCYKSDMGFSSLNFIGEEEHPFKQVPLNFYSFNNENESLAQCIYALNDAYNRLLNDDLDSWDVFTDCYMVLKGVNINADELKAMRTNRALCVDSDSDISYLTKDTSTTEIEHLLSTIETKIREIAACPNFASEDFGTSSGIAIKFRCIAMENAVSSMLSYFKKALQRRIELISEILSIKSGDEVWRDVKINFVRNIPVDEQSRATELNNLRGLVPDRILLAQLPFIDNPEEAYKELLEQQTLSASLYSFEDKDEETDEETDSAEVE